MALPRRLSHLLHSRWSLLAGYLLLAAIASVQQWFLSRAIDPSDPYTHYNNYVIYRQSFAHLVGQQELYTLYLGEHWDYFRYSPSFALAFGVFAWLPDLAGLLLWNILNVSVLFLAWRMLPVPDERITIAAGWFVAIEVMTSLQNSQSNVLLAGLLVLAFGLLERKQVAAATLMMVIAAFTKLFGLVAFSLFLLYPQKRKFILFSALWGVAVGLLPLAAVTPEQLVRLYQSWWNFLSIDYGQSAGLSVMAWLQSWFRVAPPNRGVGLFGIVMFCWPLLYVRRYRDFTFRLLFLCNILIWVVIFNHKAESSSYIIAMGGVGLWYFSQQPTRLNTALVSLAFVFTSLSPTDIFPRVLSLAFFVPYAIKAVPCILIWAKVTYELVSGQEVAMRFTVWVLLAILLGAPSSARGQEPLAAAATAAAEALALQQNAAPPPEPEHTGLAALAFDTAADFKAFPRRQSTWVILAVGAAGAALAHPADDEVNGRLAGSPAVGRLFAPGKWIGTAWVEAGTATGLYLIGRYMLPHVEGEPRTNKVSHLGFDLLRALIVSQAFTHGIKLIAQRDRPTGECCAFPSGHASSTFAMASVLERHLGYRAAWPTLALAAYVGASRLHDNRHYLSDVVFGASLGVVTGWTVVGRHGRSEYTLIPMPTRGGVMVTAIRNHPPRS